MTISDERWFAEQRRNERARGRCVAALGLGMAALVIGVAGVVTAVEASIHSADPAYGVMVAGMGGLLAAASICLVASARGVSVWSRLTCALPGALTVPFVSLGILAAVA